MSYGAAAVTYPGYLALRTEELAPEPSTAWVLPFFVFLVDLIFLLLTALTLPTLWSLLRSPAAIDPPSVAYIMTLL